MTPALSPGAPALACAHCHMPLGAETWNVPDLTFCPRCHAPVEVLVFPAMLAPHGHVQVLPAEEGEACCFYHPAKRAIIPCDHCGRFLCALCHVELAGQNWCPNCIETNRRKGRLESLDTHRMLYDNGALALATLPILLWPLTIITAPMALFVAIRYWRKPLGLVRRTRVRFYIAVLLAALQLAAWTWLGALVVSRL